MRIPKIVTATLLCLPLIVGYGTAGGSEEGLKEGRQNTETANISGAWQFYMIVSGQYEQDLGTTDLTLEGTELKGSTGISGTVQGASVEFAMQDSPEDRGLFKGTLTDSKRIEGTYVWYENNEAVQQGSFRLVQ